MPSKFWNRVRLPPSRIAAGTGYQQFGIPVSGALDTFWYRAANVLVGNGDSAAGLEITFMGPRLEALSDALLAVTGAAVPVFVNDQPQPMWRSFRVRRGDVISIRTTLKGVRAYLAIAGGLVVPRVMGSYSTYTGGKIGGVDGRPLAKGDTLHSGPADSLNRIVSLPEDFRPDFQTEITLRVLPGPQDDHFDAGLNLFFSSEFTVTSKADRMGYRLEGPTIKPKHGVPLSIISEPSLSGAVQFLRTASPSFFWWSRLPAGMRRSRQLLRLISMWWPKLGPVTRCVSPEWV